MIRALVVDDSRTTRVLVRGILASAGIEVHEAPNGHAAMAWLDAHPPVDVAFVDWNMPEMNGIDLIRAVRGSDRHRGLKLVMVTTEVESTRVKQALSAGADEYIMKPFTREALVSKLRIIGLPVDRGS